MAEKKIIDLEVRTLESQKAIDDLKKKIEALEKSLEKSKKGAEQTNKSIDDVASNGGAISILDQLTGGLATQFKNVYESTRLFNGSLKGTKTALIATGIGAFVVILGTIVAYWDEISDLIEGTTRKLETQQENLTKQLETQTVQLDLLKQQLAIEELKNGESPKLTAEYRKQLLIQREQNIALLENLQTQLELEESKNKEVSFWEKTKILATGQFGLALQAEQIAKAASKTSERSIELTNKINEAKKKTGAIDLELAQLDDKQKKKKEGEAEKAKAKRDKELEDEFNHQEKINAIREKFRLQNEDAEDITEFEKLNRKYQRDLLELERLGATEQQKLDLEAYYNSLRQTQFLENEDYLEQLEIDAEDERLERLGADAKSLSDLKNLIRDAEAVTEDERRALEIQKTIEHYNKLIDLAKARGLDVTNLETAKNNALNKLTESRAKNEINWEKLTTQEKTSIVQQGLSNLASVLGEESAAGKAAAIANATISTYQSATDSYKSLSGIPIIGPALGFAAAGAAIVSGIANVKKIASTKIPNAGGGGGSAGGISGGGGSAPSIPPAFNVVGASSTNQLADAIGSQSKEPVKAYVVSNDVTTAQSMDRNIVNGASI